MERMTSQVEKLADPVYYTEGPVVDKGGNIYFTTLLGGKIVCISSEGVMSCWARSVCPNGQYILSNGDHIVCDVKLGSLRRYSSSGLLLGDAATMADFFPGGRDTVPNDVIADRAGNIYFTDSVRYEGRVLFIGVDGMKRVLADRLDYPNGLAFSPDEHYLYLAESYRNRITRMEMMTGSWSVVTDLPRHPSGRPEDNLPDGLKVDGKGHLWVAHYGMQAVHCISADGKLLRTVDTGMPLTSNLVFFNKETLIVTGGHGEPGPGGVVKILL
jgi:gluconolactonase